MVSKKEVQHIVKLARIGLTQAETKKLQGDLSSILDYMEKIKKADTSRVKPTSHPHSIENIMREDEEKPEKPARVNKLIAAAPEQKKGYVKVKAVL